jgi:hypothetical protein
VTPTRTYGPIPTTVLSREIAMNPIVQQIAKSTGLEPALVEKGLGILLSFLQKQVSPEAYKQIESKVPGAQDMSDAATSGASGGGLLDAVTKIAGQMMGGKAGDVGGLLGKLGEAGVSGEQVASLIPSALSVLKAHVPPETHQEIEGAIPDLGSLLSGRPVPDQ